MPLAETGLKIESAHHGTVEDDRAECFTIDKATFQEVTKQTLNGVNGFSGTPKVGDIDALIDAIDQVSDGAFSHTEVSWRFLLRTLEICKTHTIDSTKFSRQCVVCKLVCTGAHVQLCTSPALDCWYHYCYPAS